MRRLLRFRLRTLLIGMAAVACFLAWRLRDPERAAVAAIEKAAGDLTGDAVGLPDA